MPDFTPNPYMLDKYDDKGNDPWEIYAWCVRDAISKHSGIKILDEKLALKDKMAFDSLMNGVSDKVEVNGQIWQYNGDQPVQEVVINPKSYIRRKSTITYAHDFAEGDFGGNNDGYEPNKSETSSMEEDLPVNYQAV